VPDVGFAMKKAPTTSGNTNEKITSNTPKRLATCEPLERKPVAYSPLVDEVTKGQLTTQDIPEYRRCPPEEKR